MKKLYILLSAVLCTLALNAKTLYLVPNDNWKQASAKFSTYYFGGEGITATFTEFMTSTDGVHYEATIPDAATTVIFVRHNSTATTPTWNNKWHQTGDLTVPTDGNNCYTVAAGAWDKGSGTWSTYTAPVTATVTAYYVNTDSWEKVYAYVFQDGAVTHWPGAEMTKTDIKVNGFDIYSYEFAETFTNIIFNNGNNGKQTDDLTVDATKPYYYDGTWYATTDEIPTLCTTEYGIMVGSEFKAFTTNPEKEGEYMLTNVLLKNADTFTLYQTCEEKAWTVALKQGSTDKVTIIDEKYVAGADGYYDFYFTPSFGNDVLYISYVGTTPTSVVTILPLDRTAPMYNILGQQVDATYRGVVFRNGTKFLLQ